MGRDAMGRAVLGLLLTFLGSCTMFGPPRWVDDFPSSDAQFIYGVGSAGVTFDRNPSKSKQYAIDRAMQDLSFQIKTEVLAVSELRDTARSSTLKVDSINLTESDLEGVEIVEVWIDRKGEVGKVDRTWVLVRMPHAQVQKILSRF